MNELKKRIFTSIVLISVGLFCIFTNSVIFLISLVAIIGLAFHEISLIIAKISKSVKKLSYFFYNLLALYYGLIIFIGSVFSLQNTNTILKSTINAGPFCLLFILLICIFSDIGGYIIGKAIGGKKLTKISPKKTISGSFGSFVFSITPLILFNYFFPSEYMFTIKNIFLCLEVSLLCQIGDIFISFLKRKARIKDTGTLLPGHGGILDRIDGMLFAIPFAWFKLSFGIL
jgi:phosphatidate cytidylyltransferase|tara:strand:- start:2491 stop:3180 length:690 start_codon:yes stop_codon:yes gene_type:complete